VGSQFDPRDIDYLEIQRGGFSAEYGDRAYGVFNVLPRTGFEGDRFGEFSTSFGSFNRTDNYLALGSHTDRFAYYGSMNGYRTDLGLETSTPEVIHNRANGLVRLRVKKASDELGVVFEDLSRKAQEMEKSGSNQSPFAEITDDDIDNLFR
jgi:outer membrane receptor protein involved in Fe transport